MGGQGGVVVADLPENLQAGHFDRAEVVLAVGIVIGVKANCGFVDGFRKSIAFRCAVPIQSIVYPRGNVSEELFTPSILAKVPTLLWVAGRINTDKNGVETVSLITAPSDERNAATSEHEPVLIDGVFLPTWFDVTVDAHLLLRSPTALRGTNPLFKAA